MENKHFFCSICLDIINNYNNISFLGCGHYFCIQCLIGWIRSELEIDHLLIECPNPKCIAIIDPMPSNSKIGPLAEKLKYINDFQVQCPYMICDQIYYIDHQLYLAGGYGSHRECEKCLQNICNFCFDPYDSDKHICHSDLQKMFYKLTKTKRCPFCKAGIEKNGGCFHIKCQQCELDFDWNRDAPPKFMDLTDRVLYLNPSRFTWGYNPKLILDFKEARLSDKIPYKSFSLTDIILPGIIVGFIIYQTFKNR